MSVSGTRKSCTQNVQGGAMPSKNDISESGVDATSLKALRFISEQASVRVDHLARYLEMEPQQAHSLAAKLERASAVRTEVFFEGDHRWLWLSRRGAEMSGTGLAHRSYPPDLKSLDHRYAINEIRLDLEKREPRGVWLSETVIQGRRPKGAQIPDGVFEVGDERHAIEVELHCKTRRHLERVLAENSDRYDAVIYFCGPRTIGLLRRQKASNDWPKLIVRELPQSLKESRRRARRDAKRCPTGEEHRALRLVSEQGTVRIDQLGRYLSLDDKSVNELVLDLVDANFADVESGLRGEPDWVALSFIGNRFSGTPLSWFRPGLGGLKERWALNELRLFFEVRVPSAKWTSRRLLIKELGKSAAVPHALVEYEGKRFAVNFRLNAQNGATLIPRTDRQNLEFDAVLFFCGTPRVRAFMERLQDRFRWSNVVIRDMPKPENFTRRPSEAELLVTSMLRD
jgi:hypothetical protein